MQIIITITTDNAAFEDNGIEAEVARILSHYARTLSDGLLNIQIPAKLRDSNGNTVGTVELRDE